MTDDAPKEYQYPRPQSVEDALQVAIGKWIRFQYRIWEQEAQRSAATQNAIGVLMRISIIILAGSITAMSEIDTIPRTTVTIISAILTILTGVEGYLKLADRKVQIENQRTEILAEYDRQGYAWMTKVQLETDPEKALEEAKKLLESGPKEINTIVARYMSRASGNEPTKPA